MVRAQIDWDRRYRHMRFHTATICCARGHTDGRRLQLTNDYARLDFAMTLCSISSVQDGLDALIASATPVACEWISDDEMRANPQLVKSMSVSRRSASAACACCA